MYDKMFQRSVYLENMSIYCISFSEIFINSVMRKAKTVYNCSSANQKTIENMVRLLWKFHILQIVVFYLFISELLVSKQIRQKKVTESILIFT